MNISQAGIDFIKRNETCDLNRYPDPRGQTATYSIGWGHFLGSNSSIMTISQATADALFIEDMRPVQASVNACVHVPITQPQFDALCDFAYNEGIHALPCGGSGGGPSTLLQFLNAGNYGMAADHFLEWDKDMRQGVLGDDPILESRRKAERAMFLSQLPEQPAA